MIHPIKKQARSHSVTHAHRERARPQVTTSCTIDAMEQEHHHEQQQPGTHAAPLNNYHNHHQNHQSVHNSTNEETMLIHNDQSTGNSNRRNNNIRRRINSNDDILVHRVEDEDVEDDGSSLNKKVNNTIMPSSTMMTIHRPVPTKVVRPIPKRASDKYYEQAYELGLTLQETNQAAMMAHDWHRKWTQQDEHDHTTPDADFYKSSTAAQHYNYKTQEAQKATGGGDEGEVVITSMYGSSTGSTVSTTSSRQILLAHAMELDRLRGAKNPSLGDSASSSIMQDAMEDDDDSSQPQQHQERDQDERLKRTRQVVHLASTDVSRELSLPLEDGKSMKDVHDDTPLLNPADRLSRSLSSSSSSCASARPQAKRRFFGSQQEESIRSNDDEFDFVGHVVGDDKKTPGIVAPVPTRPNVIRPTAIRLDRTVPQPSADTHLIRPTPIAPAPSRRCFDRTGSIGVPKDITAYSGHALSVSPMSCSPSTPRSSRSSGSPKPLSHPPTTTVDDEEMQHQQTLQRAEPHVVHVIEDDGEEIEVSPRLETKIVVEEDVEDDVSQLSTMSIDEEAQKVRDDVLQALAVTGGDVDSEVFKATINPLEKYFTKQDVDTRPMVVNTSSIDGMWLTLSKPNFFGCLGNNDNGDPMYTLGRMSFDMFSPTNLVCSLQGIFNPVEVVSEEERKNMLGLVPKSLREEVEAGTTILRTYHVVTAFTIEPSLAEFPTAPNKDVCRPIKGIMTTFGYSLPDPDTPNRHSIWFTGGRIEPNDDPKDISAWKHLFTLHPPKHSFGEKAKLLAVKLLMGATVPEEVAEDGSMEYTFTRPLGGHGMAYIDVIYLDESMRVVRGHRGTYFVFSRMPDQDISPNVIDIDDGNLFHATDKY